ncbi:hypothetical protein RSJ42_01120 [Methanosarcina hadiensis]
MKLKAARRITLKPGERDIGIFKVIKIKNEIIITKIIITKYI